MYNAVGGLSVQFVRRLCVINRPAWESPSPKGGKKASVGFHTNACFFCAIYSIDNKALFGFLFNMKHLSQKKTNNLRTTHNNHFHLSQPPIMTMFSHKNYVGGLGLEQGNS